MRSAPSNPSTASAWADDAGIYSPDDRPASDIHLSRTDAIQLVATGPKPGRARPRKPSRRTSRQPDTATHSHMTAAAHSSPRTKRAGPVPSQAWLIVVTELCERFTYYGASLMFQLYMLRELGLNQAAATAVNRGFSFFCYFTTILGAVIADQYLGKYRTILIFAALYAIGLGILTLSATPASIAGGWGLPGFLLGCYVFMGLGTGGMKANVSAFVAEQIPHNHSVLGGPEGKDYETLEGADTSDHDKHRYLDSGCDTDDGETDDSDDHVVAEDVSFTTVDPASAHHYRHPVTDVRYPPPGALPAIDYQLTVERVFRYFYWAICLGAFIGQVLCPMVAQRSTYAHAFLLPTVLFFTAVLIFWSGRKRYVHRPPTQAVLLQALRCVRYALKHRRPGQGHWLDVARPSVIATRFKADTEGHAEPLADEVALEDNPLYAPPLGAGVAMAPLASTAVPLSLAVDWDDDFVDSLRRAGRACAVFAFYPFFWAIYSNMADNFITQALTLERPDWFPPDQMNALINLVLVVIIPLFDIYIDPALRARGLRLGPIRRITLGFAIAVATFFYITVLQYVIYTTGPYYDFSEARLRAAHVPDTATTAAADAHGLYQNHVSIWWQAIPCLLMGLADFFASATGLEFAYSQAPRQMKSVVVALYLFTSCLGSLLGLIVAYWSHDPNFIYVYGFQTVIMLLATLLFSHLFSHWDQFM
ncbi:hypothetical protein IWQ60_006057 [Tieghemiomyces parasiticus]|uniref:Peptide transporter n=1 Tax=Tieghemiomyces parasiticus TaxID=78921 RepID=A0A9W8DYB9_9FUNG|nr:hypothetical protein IWQ60_006057 [Tieghemiomyces parasiticus]